jgi:hypothetical protein
LARAVNRKQQRIISFDRLFEKPGIDVHRAAAQLRDRAPDFGDGSVEAQLLRIDERDRNEALAIRVRERRDLVIGDAHVRNGSCDDDADSDARGVHFREKGRRVAHAREVIGIVGSDPSVQPAHDVVFRRAGRRAKKTVQKRRPNPHIHDRLVEHAHAPRGQSERRQPGSHLTTRLSTRRPRSMPAGLAAVAPSRCRRTHCPASRLSL